MSNKFPDDTLPVFDPEGIRPDAPGKETLMVPHSQLPFPVTNQEKTAISPDPANDPTLALPHGGQTQTNLTASELPATVHLDSRAATAPPRQADHTDAATAQTMPLPTTPPSQQDGASAKPALEEDLTPNRRRVSNLQTELIGKNVGGYHVRRMIGAGGMGCVCLARQVSLDRDVALKVMPGHLADNPDFVARFTREALSAAAMTHHNVVQVYDFGTDRGVHYISMEFVRGRTLRDIVKEDGKLEPEDAAAYTLQAARGLKYAHEHGIIHRDIKPDNLMLNEHGVVKIADMGLAKIIHDVEATSAALRGDANTAQFNARADLTRLDIAMGTPAYMAPEQGRNASTVDGRADQYSLGCTLYYLLTGKAPHSGGTAFDIISKHQSEPVPPVDVHAPRVPAALKVILERMLEKDRERRYPSMVELIRDIETFLGLETDKGPYTPREVHLRMLEKAQKGYAEAKFRHVRQAALIAFFVLVPLVALILFFAGQPALGLAALSLLVITPLAAITLSGLKGDDVLFRRLRAGALGAPWKMWALGAAVVLLGAALIVLLGLISLFIGALALGITFAVLWRFGVLLPLRRQRADALGSAQEMARQLRLRGVSEEALMEFVARFSDSEELFENLFGYEALVRMRTKLARLEGIARRSRYGAWRDPLVRWLDGLEESRRHRRERDRLAAAEKKRLRAKGLTEKEAQERADEEARKAFSEGPLSRQPLVYTSSGKYVPVKEDGKKVRLVSAGTMFRVGARVLRLAVGAGVAAIFLAFALPSLVPIPIPDALATRLPLRGAFFVEFLSMNLLVAVAGVLLAATVFTRKTGGPTLLLLGIILMAGARPFDALSPYAIASATMFFYIGMALTVLGTIGTLNSRD